MPAKALLRSAAEALQAVADNPTAEAEWLLAAALGTSRAAVQAGLHESPNAQQLAQFRQWVVERSKGVPFAYVVGEQPFRQLNLRVSPDVLIPRPETEQLVDWALALIAPGACALDICTGSGCIALSLALESPSNPVWASDVSEPALRLAKQNAERLGLMVSFVQAKGFALPDRTPKFQLIVGNPPYIAEHDPHLPALHHEPALALVSGADGLALIRELVADAPQWLLPGGWLLLEHGFDQAALVQGLMREVGFGAVTSHRDHGGQLRATQGQWP